MNTDQVCYTNTGACYLQYCKSFVWVLINSSILRGFLKLGFFLMYFYSWLHKLINKRLLVAYTRAAVIIS